MFYHAEFFFHPSMRSFFFFLLSIQEKKKTVFKRNPCAIRITRYSVLTWNSLLPHDLAFLIYFSFSLQLSHTKRYENIITLPSQSQFSTTDPKPPTFFFFPFSGNHKKEQSRSSLSREEEKKHV